ncbi:DUF1963 domain-containing protein [Vreelandella sp. EE27]
MRERLDTLLAPLIQNAQVVTSHADPAMKEPSLESKFGGAPYAEADTAWPMCRLCEQPLSFILQLFDASANAMFVFYYCHHCLPAGDDPRDRGLWHAQWFKAPESAKQTHLERSCVDVDATTPCRITTQTARVLPDWEGLYTHSPKAETLCGELDPQSPWEALNDATTRAGCLDELKSWRGGYPHYLQGEHVPDCPHCQAPMTFFVQIDSEEEANLDWGACGLIYVFYCAQHPQTFEFVRQNT